MFMTRRTYNAMQENKDLVLKQNRTLEKYLGVMTEQLQEYNTTQLGSAYTTRSAQVAETRKKHKGEATFGNQITQRIIALRVAFSVPNRLFLITNEDSESKDKAPSVKTFLNAFMKLNGLDQEIPRDFAKEIELHGQVLVRIVWDPKEKIPRLKYYPWGDKNYKIEPTDKHLLRSKLKCSFTLGNSKVDMKDDDFVFIAFNDELNSYEGRPTCGGILKTLENLDKDLQDWRRLNHLFAHPTPHFKCESAEEAIAVRELLKTIGWRVGTAIATSAELSMKGTTGAEANLLMLSIQTGAKIISAHTGIGIHFLGFANVMSNRATADSMGEPTEVVLHSEITSWQGFYANLFMKAIRLRNKKLNKPLPEDAVLPRLVPLTDRQWKILKDIFMFGAEKHLISHETMLSKIPGIDPEAEMVKIKAEEAVREKKNEERMEKAAAAKGAENDDNNGNNGSGESGSEDDNGGES